MAKRESRICTSIGADTLRGLEKRASLAFSLGSDLVELRVDRLSRRAPPGELEARLAPYAERGVFTVRSAREGGGFRGSEAQRLELISRLAELRPAYLDIELAAAKANKKWMASLPRDVERIVSWHDFQGTPGLGSLRAKCSEGLGHGSLVKVVTTATSMEDNLVTLALCADRPGKVISFCMGALGTVSRVVSMRLGAPLAYASLPNEEVAPGQLSTSTMRSLRSMVA